MKFSNASHKLITEAMELTKQKGFIEGYVNIPGLLWAIIRSNESILNSFAEYLAEADDYEVTIDDIEETIMDVFKMEEDCPGLRDLEIVVKASKNHEEIRIMQPKDKSESVKKEITVKEDSLETDKNESANEKVGDIKSNVETNVVSIPISFVQDTENSSKTNIQLDVEQLVNVVIAIEKGKTAVKSAKTKEDDKKKKSEKAAEVVERTRYHYYDAEGNEHTVIVDESMSTVLCNFFVFEEEFGISLIEPIHFLSALFYKDIDEVKDFFLNIELSYHKAKKHFDIDVMKSGNCISKELEGFLSILNDEVDITKPCEILGRNKETDILINILMKKNKRNAVIIGEAGVGKTALIECLTYLIKSKASPDIFWDIRVVLLDVNALIAGTSFRGDAEKRIEGLIKFLKKNKDVILFIDEVHTILGAGSCYEGEMDLANALKPILARGDTRVIGATTETEYEKYFAKDAALQRRFEKVEVEEPSSEKVYEMIKNKIKGLSDYHEVTISKQMVEYIILIANCFAFNKRNPDKTLDLIDRAMVVAKRNGSKNVKKDHVKKNFAIYDELWENMIQEEKRRIAYHETGHYLVCKYSGRLIDHILIAVSIMPAEGYLGVTVYEKNKKQTPHTSKKYFIDLIAKCLAGRVAEEFLIEGEYTAGASSDLESATEIARTVIAEYGMGEKIGVNRVYSNSCHQPMFSDKIVEEVNSEMDSLIKDAMTRAKEILTENKDIFMAIQEELLKNHILSEKELDVICQKKIAERSK